MEENGKTWKDFPDLRAMQTLPTERITSQSSQAFAEKYGKLFWFYLVFLSLDATCQQRPRVAFKDVALLFCGCLWIFCIIFRVAVSISEHWLVSDLSGVKHQKRRKTRLCCRSEGSGLWMWLDATCSATCRLAFFNFPVASHVCHWICCLHVINMKCECARLCAPAFMAFYASPPHLSGIGLRFQTLSFVRIPHSEGHHFLYLIHIYTLFSYSCIVIFSWKQDQVLGETFHLFKSFGCEQQPALSACGCGQPVHRDVTGLGKSWQHR